MPEAIALVIGYLVGSVTLGVPISRAFGGVDIRTVGSGNPGFTNVLRSVGRTAGLLTLAADVGKGVIAVLAGRAVGAAFEVGPLVPGAIACAGAILGHALPLFYGFRGGKGVATAAGGFVTLVPAAALTSTLVWLAVLTTTRYMSAASIAGALTLPIYLTWIRRPSSGSEVLLPVAWCVAAAIVLLHRSNLARLARGTERKFSLKRR